MQDLFNSIHPVVVLAPAVIGDSDPEVGAVVDRQGYDSLTFVIQTGSLADADATFATLVEHCDTIGGSYTAVADDELLGTESHAGFAYDDDNKVFKIGYRGAKRYVRLTVTPTGNTGDAYVSAVGLLGHPHVAPTANPPA